MPRVSEILDHFCEPYLVAWKLKTKDWQKVSQDALTLGTAMDTWVQGSINEDVELMKSVIVPIHLKDQFMACESAWTKFKAERPDVFNRLRQFKHNMQRELTLGDLVGHPDFILDDEVIDLKTSKQVSKSHWMQTAQYATMVNWGQPLSGEYAYSPIKRISILRLDKESGEYQFQTLEEPFISFWQRKFQARYEAFCEDKEFSEMMRVKLEEEKL